ncbi:MAG: hypothetical protein OZ913_05845 [Ignavibacteriaceae bacterium]|nr:hypothetical protein [Ignavibacteria bacterium]MCC6886567.1 hypothetical protein [Ignavibacteriales bacterium]MEB2329807.1 hypothetical protein [Ignavibacteriaceae bacterium]
MWRERVREKFHEFDYAWIADHYAISEQQARHAVDEMLGVIEQRLVKINTENA